MKFVSATDIGLMREENQDIVRVEEYYGNVLAVVCDGMGGERSGQDASRIAINEVFSRFSSGFSPDLDTIAVRQLMTASISAANSIVYTTARIDYKSFGMGTTCVAVYIDDKYIYIANVGDSRAYHVGKSGIRQVTKDHSLVQMMVDRGELTPEVAKSYPGKNFITRAIGTETTVLCDIFHLDVGKGDYLLLCSDGLSNLLDDQEILFEVVHGVYKQNCCKRLLNIAKNRGAPDNVTSVLIAT